MCRVVSNFPPLCAWGHGCARGAPLRYANAAGTSSGITGCWKLINVCQAYGLKCEIHGGGWAHAQLLGAAPEATCLYYERGLLRPGLDDPLAAPYLNSSPDPLDDDGNVIISQQPGLGLDLNWDYINEHHIG